MANTEHVEIFKQGVLAWNEWRLTNPDIEPDLAFAFNLEKEEVIDAILSGANVKRAKLGPAFENANLNGADLSEADLEVAFFMGADLSDANLSAAKCKNANFKRAKLRNTDFSGADLNNTNFQNADLSGANLNGADLSWAGLPGSILHRADLTGANLTGAQLIRTDLTDTTLCDCRVYGISVWDIYLDGAKQSNLIVTHTDLPSITVDSLPVAQFVYLLLRSENLRDIITTIGQKAVLILGRFSIPERKEILEAIRNKLREEGFLPIVFDFEKSVERDFTETIKVLAGMSLFVIADITNPKSSPLELQAVVPDYMIPFVPIIQTGENPFAMFADLRKYPWMLALTSYDDKQHLIDCLEGEVIKPALRKHEKLRDQKNMPGRVRRMRKK